MPSPPTPFHVLRTHHAAISCLAFSENNTLLYAGDQDGFVSVTDLKGRRVVRYWKAHEGGVLSVAEWDGRLISHGRDNVIHVYRPIPRLRLTLTSGPSPSSAPPDIDRSLPTNSLNFCRFALLPMPHASPAVTRAQKDGKGKGRAVQAQALLAVPSLVDLETADIYLLPDMRRLHASVNAPDPSSSKNPVEDGKVRSGLIMGLQLGFLGGRASGDALGLIIGFEDGRVEKWELATREGGSGGTNETSSGASSESEPSWMQFSDGKGAIGPRRWTLAWQGKGHNEAVMAMTATCDLTRALTVSADHQMAVYDLTLPHSDSSSDTGANAITRHSVKQIGNASVALTPEEAVVAVGGWDGKTRLFSAATGKPLGTLPFHRDTVQVVAFPSPARPSAPTQSDPTGRSDEQDGADSQSAADFVSVDETMEIGGSGSSDDTDDDDDYDGHTSSRGGRRAARWMATGGKDTKVALWELMDFGSGRTPRS